jgi:hypothetical protein
MSFQPHSHHPLPDPKAWIRLMQVTRNQSGTVSCTLHAFKVSELAPESFKFFALSYEWGPPRDLVEIQVDGSPLQIRPTLSAILTKVADGNNHPDNLWFADAICIDQENIVERDAQVLLMGWIFNNARATHCWLGEAANGVDELLEMLYIFGDVKSMDEFEPTKLSELVREEYVRVFGTLDRLLLWDAVTAFLKRSYWSRVWMQQEILLANRLIFWCGDNMFEGYLIEAMIEHSRDINNLSVYNGWSIFSPDYGYQLSQREIDENNRARRLSTPSEKVLRELRSGRPASLFRDIRRRRIPGQTKLRPAQTRSLEELIEEYGHSKCSDVRDRVYGFLGLANDNVMKGNFVVKYSQNTVGLFFDTLAYCRPQRPLEFAKQLHEMLELKTEVLSGPLGSLSQRVLDSIPAHHRHLSFSAEVRLEETLIYHPILPVTSYPTQGSLKSFRIRSLYKIPPVDMHAFPSMPILGFTGLTYADIRYSDLLYRIAHSSCGLIIRKSVWLNPVYRCVGRFVMAYPDTKDQALALLNRRFEYCSDLAERPPRLSKSATNTTVSVSAQDMLILALNTDPNYFGDEIIPRGSHGLALMYPTISDAVRRLFVENPDELSFIHQGLL